MKSWPYRMSSKLKKFEKWVVNAELTNNTFSPVSGWVSTTGCSAAGFFAAIA
ncbi:hypothetical protein AWB81_08611 [Caballeronia arationis]|nr:hypothetical protein AWB81_08611 [Caballeronia arationis]